MVKRKPRKHTGNLKGLLVTSRYPYVIFSSTHGLLKECKDLYLAKYMSQKLAEQKIFDAYIYEWCTDEWVRCC
jgi:hypothetical protein